MPIACFSSSDVRRSQLAGNEVPSSVLNGVSKGSGVPFSRNMGYLAREFLNGTSANANPIYVAPLSFVAVPVPRILKPLLKKSMLYTLFTASALLKLGNSLSALTFIGLLLVSCIHQLSTAEETFTITNLGLNPKCTKGPSALPLPVYENARLKPATAANK